MGRHFHIRRRATRYATDLVALRWFAVLSVLIGSGSHADVPWSASVGATSNYVYRGVSESHNGGALQLGVNYQSSSGWFAGAWGTNVELYPGASSFKELDLYGGYSLPVGDEFSLRGTYTRYAYLQNPLPLNYDHDEIAATLSYLDVLAATVSYEPDTSAYSELGLARKRMTLAYELSGRLPLGRGVALTAGAGYYDLHDLYRLGYWAGDVGLSYAWRRVTVDVSRFFSDGTVARLYQGASANGAWVVTAVVHF
jgi:uncharacterized protein (TIGR02001 family)